VQAREGDTEPLNGQGQVAACTEKRLASCRTNVEVGRGNNSPPGGPGRGGVRRRPRGPGWWFLMMGRDCRRLIPHQESRCLAAVVLARGAAVGPAPSFRTFSTKPSRSNRGTATTRPGRRQGQTVTRSNRVHRQAVFTSTPTRWGTKTPCGPADGDRCITARNKARGCEIGLPRRGRRHSNSVRGQLTTFTRQRVVIKAVFYPCEKVETGP